MNRPGDSFKRQNDMQTHSGRIPMNKTTGFPMKRKPLKVNYEMSKGNSSGNSHKHHTNSQKSSQILVPIPKTYKASPPKTELAEEANLTNTKNTITKNASLSINDTEENVSSIIGQSPSNASAPVSVKKQNTNNEESIYSKEDFISLQTRNQEEAELKAIRLEKNRKLEDEEQLRQMEVAQVAQPRKNHYGNARVVINNPDITEHSSMEPHPNPTGPKESSFVKKHRVPPRKDRVKIKPAEVHKEGEFVLSGEEFKQVQSLLDTWKHLEKEAFTEIAENQFNYGVLLDEEPVVEAPPVSSLQGFATDLTSSQSSLSPAGQVSMPSMATPMMPVQPSPQSNYVIPMNQMYPGITYIQPVYSPDFYIDYVWPQQGLTWTIPSGIPPSYPTPMMPGQQYSYTMPSVNEPNA